MSSLSERQNLWQTLFTILAFGALTVTAASAQKFKSLASFTGPNGNGEQPWSLVQGTNGNLYGTTQDFGGFGTIYQISPAGKLTLLLSLDYTDGDEPTAGMVLGTNGNF